MQRAALASVALALLANCRFEPGAIGARDDAALDDSGRDATETDAMALDASPDAMPDAAVAKPCPSSYTLTDAARPNSKYRLITASTDWAQAETACEADGGGAFLPTHLVVLDDADERTWVYQQGTTDKWIGVTDLNNEGTLLAVTDQPNPHFGNAGANQQSKDCMFVNQNETVLEDCSAGFQYICECDGRAADPARY